MTTTPPPPPIRASPSASLAHGAWLLVEHGYDQALAVQALLHAHGISEISTRVDLAGQPRCTGGRHG